MMTGTMSTTAWPAGGIPPSRYVPDGRARAGSLVMACGLTALMVLGIAFAAPNVTKGIDKILLLTPVHPDPPPPPPEKPKPVDQKVQQAPRPQPEIKRVDPIVEHPVTDTNSRLALSTSDRPTENMGTAAAEGTGGGIVEPPAPPVFVDPAIDPRYADDLQPAYPAEDRSEAREGVVVVRVLVGPNGRVLQVERVSAPSDTLFEATRRQALSRWRFKPGTRDGVAIERWRVMRVSFHLTDD